MHAAAQDLRYALRTFRKNPLFTAVALISLTLGIGANTAIFTLLDQVLLRMLPVREPERLVLLDAPGPNRGSFHDDNAFSYPMYVDFRDRNQVFSGMLARYGFEPSLTWQGQSDRVNGELVSGNYFHVLGVPGYLGRLITADDDRARGAHPVVVLTHGFWQRRFGGDRAAVGRKVLLNGHPFEVIGVAPPGFNGVELSRPRDLFVPMAMKAQMTPTWNEMDNRRVMWLNVYARLKPGVTVEQAAAGMQVLLQQNLRLELEQMSDVSEYFTKRFLDKKLVLVPGYQGRSDLRRRFRTPLIVLMAMVGLVLLIACANVANLLTARAAARHKEVAVRLALGASKWQLARQYLVESLALAGGGGVLGLILAVWLGDLLVSFLPFEGAARLFSTSPDLRVLAFTFAISLLAGLVFGMAPAFQATRWRVAGTLKEEGASVSSAIGQVRFRKTLVTAQIALSLLLLIGAGLFARSLYNLRTLHPGLETERLLTFSLNAPLAGYSPQRTLAAYEQVQSRLARLPGVTGVTLASTAILANDLSMSTVRIEGYHSKEGEDMNPDVNQVGPDFIKTMGIQIVEGRDFTLADRLGAPKVAVINETMARKYFGGQSPLGRHIGFGSRRPVNIRIVGVVKDGKVRNLRDSPPRTVYVPYFQEENPSSTNFYVRTSVDPMNVASAIRREITTMDANLPIAGLRTMERQLDELLFIERLVALLSSFFGLLATLLAAVGLYGVMAFTVARRTREIGIRMALGAARRRVMAMVMAEVALLAGIGVLIGLPGSLALGKYVRTQLFGIEPNDPATIAIATATLVLIALFAGYLPARRATRIDPAVALRYE